MIGRLRAFDCKKKSLNAGRGEVRAFEECVFSDVAAKHCT